MRGPDRVQGYDAWGYDLRFVDVALCSKLVVGLRFRLKLCRVDELIAPKTAALRGDGPNDAEHIRNFTCRRVGADLTADLNARNIELMNDLVEEQTGTHGVCGQKQIVALEKGGRLLRLLRIGDAGINHRVRVGASDYACCYLHFVRAEPLPDPLQPKRSVIAAEKSHRVPIRRASYARQIRGAYAVRVDQNETSDTKVSKVLGD
jgi:hypothetical protein